MTRTAARGTAPNPGDLGLVKSGTRCWLCLLDTRRYPFSVLDLNTVPAGREWTACGRGCALLL